MSFTDPNNVTSPKIAGDSVASSTIVQMVIGLLQKDSGRTTASGRTFWLFVGMETRIVKLDSRSRTVVPYGSSFLTSCQVSYEKW